MATLKKELEFILKHQYPHDMDSMIKWHVFLFQVTIVLRMDDKMNRQLQARFEDSETSEDLADELVQYGFINVVSSFTFRVSTRS